MTVMIVFCFNNSINNFNPFFFCFVIMIDEKKMQNKHLSMSEQPQNKYYSNTKANSNKLVMTISKEVTGTSFV